MALMVPRLSIRSRTTFLLAVLLFQAALASEGVIKPEHDDHGGHEPIPGGTQSALCQSGVSGGFACKNIELLARMPLDEIGGGNSGADSWGWVDSESGRQYALMARSNGTAFVDISDPESPVYLGNLPSTVSESGWRDVKVYANHAFIVADSIPGHGMQVFDLTRLRGVETPQSFSVDALYSGVGSAHNVAINEESGFAYIVGSPECAGGLHIVDVRTPKSPVFAGCFSDDGYTHDAQCVTYTGPDSEHQGAEVCFASNEDSLTIVDVSNKASPVMLGKAPYEQTGYSHQGWLDAGQSLFLMGDELDELTFGMNTRTVIFDVRDLENPVFAADHAHAITSIDHNLYVKGDYVYQANYLAGLRVLRLDRLEGISLQEVAYFDTAPGIDALEFDGAWNVYPFFDNGTVIVSDMSSGLFILRVALDETEPESESAPLNGKISGAWVADGLNDQGIMLFVEELESGPIVFFAWFVFLDGEPFWLTGAKAFEYGEDEVEIPTQRLDGLEFLMPGEQQANREDVGILKIHVHGCNDLHIEYDFGDLGSDELEFQRLAGVQGRACTD